MKTKCIGILTAGGDCPGLNAAIRGVAKAAIQYGIRVVGIQDGFRGLVENRIVDLDNKSVSGILTQGGTMLGSSRDRLSAMPMGDKTLDMTDVAVSNLTRLHIDCLVCLGGDGTQRGALYLQEKGGVNVMTLPKTIDNDVGLTDITFGFDTALGIATEAIDRLHTTATSHHRIIICEIMGHDAGWLALGAGIAGGADVILIPEIPYDLSVIGQHIDHRRMMGKRFSIIALAEGAVSIEELTHKKKDKPKVIRDGMIEEPKAHRIARQLRELTGVDARVTSLGHVQRGGAPSATDRLLCTRLGAAATQLLNEGTYNVMVGIKNNACVPFPLHEVAGKTKLVPPDHPWVKTAHLVDTCMGAPDCMAQRGL
ncbi:MAG: 6-phosphofructokinase [Verrucomicrobia bacterium GWF2_51_19]|nr:MAG: 6-phosphofructokinase [Verrucomicrobia bacterium GWF2_51_19]HCJ12035.1 6-phosphofructokinase [Opitutae bacterium]